MPGDRGVLGGNHQPGPLALFDGQVSVAEEHRDHGRPDQDRCGHDAARMQSHGLVDEQSGIFKSAGASQRLHRVGHQQCAALTHQAVFGQDRDPLLT